MNTVISGVMRHRKAVIAAFIALTLICAVLFFGVKVNYDLTDYLPEDAESTVALRVMEEEFTASVPNARVMVPNVGLTQALAYKAQIAGLEGVTEVLWLDDVADLKQPVEFMDPALVDEYYKDGAALFSVTIADGQERNTLDDLYDLIGEDGAVTGNAATVAVAQKMTVTEVLKAVAILLPIIIVLLLITTTSWIAPLLFLLTIGVAVVINLGTNIFFKDISYITQSVSPILQLAVSLDYAIFLLNSFERHRQDTPDVEEAMRRAVKQSFSSIAASAVTTLFGFLALMFMRFGIGSDLGLNLVKGVVLSYVSVMVFLPALALALCGLIDKTRHKRILPEFSGIGKGLTKLRVPALILVVVLVVPCFLAQSRNNFLYGNGEPDADSRFGRDTAVINETFGQSTPIVLLVPRGDTGREAQLCSELADLPHITTVMSYAASVGTTVPEGFLDDAVLSNFYSENYARIIVYTDTGEEGGDAFATVDAVRETADQYYDGSLSCGQSVNLYDIRDVVTGDSTKVNLLAIAFILLTLLFTFRSVTLPVILLFVIESAIWLNLSIPYFTGMPLVYMGFLVMNTVQLGATIDYAILMTDGYKANRRLMGRREAVEKTLGENFLSVLTSALILTSAGFCIGFVSTVEVVSSLGILLARGTLLSLAMVLLVLPGLLLLFDRATAKLTFRANFLKEEKEVK